MGAFDCPAVGSSGPSSPLVELITCTEPLVSAGTVASLLWGADSQAFLSVLGCKDIK